VCGICRYCTRVQRTGIEVLRDFPSARPPVELLLDLFPRIRPRPYSIASAHRVSPNRIALCISHVQFLSRSKYHRVGLCSSFLARAEPGYRVALKVCPGSFKVPPLNTPLIMVGPGTGIAPLRAIYLDRAHARAHGETVSRSDALFFGCRDESDWLYKVRKRFHL
jgi:sulfite reductase alpha subunit-like flavoprotein